MSSMRRNSGARIALSLDKSAPRSRKIEIPIRRFEGLSFASISQMVPRSMEAAMLSFLAATRAMTSV
jgi:hypothetical protein